MAYPRIPFIKGAAQAVLTTNRVTPTTAPVRPPHAGNVIVIHGVNDVGAGFSEVEQGLCAGLQDRLGWRSGVYQPATYHLPKTDELGTLLDDPDAVFFKREVDDETYSPVIPFYWGYREVAKHAQAKRGQFTDRYGNRLDKDYSKGGGPFGNATTTLPDMWAKGAAYFGGFPDWKAHDPLRPILAAAGRMYMVLAAKRLANLANVIRAYDPEDTVSVVAHSQGCLISLLAQAFLLQDGGRPIDTLVLTHPPYSLEETALETLAKTGDGGHDAAMEGHYTFVSGVQTLNARLQTLARIVKGVYEHRNASPWIPDPVAAQRSGVVSTRWEKSRDRDNRGKVYLYFSPEDMTVALQNIQGIGWQGVPESASGTKTTNRIDGRHVVPDEPLPYEVETFDAEPLKELGPSFLQRVFTGKLRPDKTGNRGRVPVGLPPPHDFVLQMTGEDGTAHADREASKNSSSLPTASNLPNRRGVPARIDMTDRKAIRVITGEALPTAFLAEMHAGALPDSNGHREKVDPIDAAISVTSDYGLRELPATEMADPRDAHLHRTGTAEPLRDSDCAAVEQALNQGKTETDSCHVLRAHYLTDGTLRVVRTETPNEARLRQQQSGTSARSFHSAIFGSQANHQHVTAYDVAIGQGKASSDPMFYRYLCAIADWRLTKPKDGRRLRSGILEWTKFLANFGPYFAAEPAERAAIIEGSCDYYSSGVLPPWVPVLPNGLPPTVVCETTLGHRVMPPAKALAQKIAMENEPETFGEYLASHQAPPAGGSTLS